MGVDYRVEVYRKGDDKKIAEFICNWFKGLFENTDLEPSDFHRFESKDIENAIAKIEEKIEFLNEKLFSKRMIVPLCNSVDVKREIEEDIHYLKNDINEYESANNSAHIILGRLGLVVEDNINENGKMAYEYNMNDLNASSKEGSYLFVNDVYCKLIAEY